MGSFIKAMDIFIALLRGVNVGGKNILPMKELVDLLSEMGLRQVKTYIQSGNVVFRSEGTDSDKLSQDISAAIAQKFEFTPPVLTLSIEAFGQAITANPFTEVEDTPKALHLFFLASKPTSPDLDSLDAIQKSSERFALIDSVFYLFAPEGIGRSKLAAKIEKAMNVPVTARNWRSVNKIMSMAEALNK